MSNLIQFPKKTNPDEFTELDLKVSGLLCEFSMKAIILSLVSVASDDEMALIAPAAREVFNLDFESK